MGREQTLNLTKGGQGDPAKRWKSLLAASRIKLKKVWPAFEAYFKENGHLRIPKKEIVNGVKLGKVVNHIRSQKCFLHHTDFKEWLEEHGFVYDEIRAHLEEEVWPAFEAYFQENGHLRVPFKEIVNGVNLGIVVNRIRSQKYFLHHKDFKEWLEEHGFVYDETRAHLEEKVWPAFKTYFQENGHLRIPKKEIVNGVNLGQVVSGIRSRKDFLYYKDFAMWLWYGCFEMHTKDVDENRKRWESVFA
jgi:hypothetical protein